MINKLIICNQNILNIRDDLKIDFESKPVTIRLFRNSILRLKPHLYTAIIDGTVHFNEERIEVAGLGSESVNIDDFKKSLGLFLKGYFLEKTQSITCKMDLVRLYASFNDIESTMKVIKQMTRSPNVRMIEFILKTTSSMSSPGKDVSVIHTSAHGEIYDSFLEICKDLDFHSCYLFAIEAVSILPPHSLFRMHADIKDNNAGLMKKKDSFEIKQGHSTEESLKYELDVFLRIRIACELMKRNHTRMAAVTLIRLAKDIYDITGLGLEVLRMGYSLLDGSYSASDCDHIHPILQQEYLCLELMLSPSHIFYITSQESRDTKIEVSGCTEIFTFNVVKARLRNVFTDQFIVQTSTREEIMGIVGSDGAFYPANGGKIRSDRTVECCRVILKNGLQIESYFKMEKIVRNVSMKLVRIDAERDSVGLEFKYSGRSPPSCYFIGAVSQRIEQDRLIVVFERDIRTIECDMEIKPGIYEAVCIALVQ